jgi:energy-converting hydrogenase A subunit R
MKQSSRQRIFISDCEGPISKNDNAFELANHYIPDGNRLFMLISKYDDVLADIVKRPGYKAGDTLKLILPFLKAYRVTNQAITDYSSKNVLLVPGAKEMLQFVRNLMPSFIVSTSYEQYMRALCDLVDFSFKNVQCTRLNLDKYKITEKEISQIKRLREKMVTMQIPEIPMGAESLKDFPKEPQDTVNKLDEIFWKELSQMQVGATFREVNPVGGDEKAEAVENISAQLKTSMHNVMYVGDSITDVSAFKLVREKGGLTVSFNGNAYAVREAEIAVLSENAIVTAVLADAFQRFDKKGVMRLVQEWSPSTLDKFGLTPSLKKRVFELCKNRLPRVEVVTSQNRDRLMEESASFRKRVRGEAVGRLG